MLINASQVRIQPTGHEVEDAVTWAIECGYRHIDTAYIYRVEDQVGRAIAKCIERGIVKREELFITTKVSITCFTYLSLVA